MGLGFESPAGHQEKDLAKLSPFLMKFVPTERVKLICIFTPQIGYMQWHTEERVSRFSKEILLHRKAIFHENGESYPPLDKNAPHPTRMGCALFINDTGSPTAQASGRPHLSRKPPQRMTIRSITAPMPKIPAVSR